jgi:DNA-binding winged helix-turn-helix (wHTH) protein
MAAWDGGIVSESALTSRLNGARSAVRDSGEEQPHLIKSLPRKGLRFVGTALGPKQTKMINRWNVQAVNCSSSEYIYVGRS